jgi:hypothetical protein
VLYFDYASNMDEAELKGYVTQQGGDPRGINNPRYALLPDWRLVFNFLSPRRQAGAASIEPAMGEQVEGVIWDVTEDLIQYIDQKEGHPWQYHRIWVTVKVRDSILQNILTYEVVLEQRREFCPPTRAYLQLMIDAAHRFSFSQDYIIELENIQTLD